LMYITYVGLSFIDGMKSFVAITALGHEENIVTQAHCPLY
jgi:hypothetical protein